MLEHQSITKTTTKQYNNKNKGKLQINVKPKLLKLAKNRINLEVNSVYNRPR